MPSRRLRFLPTRLMILAQPIWLGLAASLTFAGCAVTVVDGPPDGPPPGSPPPQEISEIAPALPALDQLLAPIALYPDPLIALILPASTYPGDIQAAAAYLNANGDPSQTYYQPWNASVQGLAHYPQVVAWMNQNLGWTEQMGAAFATQPAEVMNAIQDLRSRARAAGALNDTPQQVVVFDSGAINIEPAQPDYIYVPTYDPTTIYYARPGGYYDNRRPFLTFGNPYPIGAWLAFDFDWHRHTVWQGDWYQYHRDHDQGSWSRPIDPRQIERGSRDEPRRWAPPPDARRERDGGQQRYDAPRPFAPNYDRPASSPPPRDQRKDDAPRARDDGRQGFDGTRPFAPAPDQRPPALNSNRPDNQPLPRDRRQEPPVTESRQATPSQRESYPPREIAQPQPASRPTIGPNYSNIQPRQPTPSYQIGIPRQPAPAFQREGQPPREIPQPQPAFRPVAPPNPNGQPHQPAPAWERQGYPPRGAAPQPQPEVRPGPPYLNSNAVNPSRSGPVTPHPIPQGQHPRPPPPKPAAPTQPQPSEKKDRDNPPTN